MIYLKTDFEIALLRGVNRDAEHLGSVEAAVEKFNTRYHKASKIHIAENSPEEVADIVIDNADFEDLKIMSLSLSLSLFFRSRSRAMTMAPLLIILSKFGKALLHSHLPSNKVLNGCSCCCCCMNV